MKIRLSILLKNVAAIGGLCFVFVACSSSRMEGVEEALSLAGENRRELEAALGHFAGKPEDSLKLRACEYLIANMPGHYGYGGNGVAGFRAALDSLHGDAPFLCQALQSVYCRVEALQSVLRKVDDITEVTAGFLIRHIERCFALRERLPWLQHLPFREFCDYVLPYRLEYERLEDMPSLLDSLWLQQEQCRLAARHYDAVYHLPRAVAELCHPRYFHDARMPQPWEGKYELECYEYALLQLYYYRSIGIPCALDAVPAWGNVDGAHFWTMVADPFYHERMPEELAFRKVPKVYRFLYRRNAVLPAGEYVPDFFREPFWHDVTDRYVPTADVEVEVPRRWRDGRSVYLCVFKDRRWEPVGYALPEGRVARFGKIGYDVVYLPVCYEGGRQIPLGAPFVPERCGGVRELVCAEGTVSFTACRKYPYNHKGIGGASMVGTRFECANRADFGDAEVFYRVEDNTLMEVREVVCPPGAYRYWRLRPSGMMSLAEIAFVAGDTMLQGFRMAAAEGAEVCLDGDPLTYRHFSGVVDVDFGKAVKLDAIRYLPMNDGNGIFPGNVYELCQWTGRKWQSLVREVAEGYSLEFAHVPAGGLYWLRNLTTGREERIFTVEEGKMRFY